jgi:hypothetical protein
MEGVATTPSWLPIRLPMHLWQQQEIGFGAEHSGWAHQEWFCFF